MPEILRDVPLARFTTLGLGGKARYFVPCGSRSDFLYGLQFARSRHLPVFLLGGGSNSIVADEGFDGVVLHVKTKGIAWKEHPGGATVIAESGEEWDTFVLECIQHRCVGIECLSGIPGTVGATPIQNVGAYGQEVSRSIVFVETLSLDSFEPITFTKDDCAFGYRTSIFKKEEAGRALVLAVGFQFRTNGNLDLHYGELARLLAATIPGDPTIEDVRRTVLMLRKQKSMLIDPADPDSRSAGSFFLNPIVTPDQATKLQTTWPELPVFPASTGVKLSAAWLVEHAGYPRGYRFGGAAVSDKHALALVNKGTTTQELLTLASNIEDAVRAKFEVFLSREPVFISPGG